MNVSLPCRLHICLHSCAHIVRCSWYTQQDSNVEELIGPICGVSCCLLRLCEMNGRDVLHIHGLVRAQKYPSDVFDRYGRRLKA